MSDIGRIKSNIQIMIDKGASEDEIDSYVSSEGVSLDQLQAPPPKAVNEQIQPPIAGGGPDGSDLNWNDPGFPVSPPPLERKWYEGDPGSYSGTLLPFSRKENAEPGLSGTDFDSNAGIVGPIKRTGKLTNEVYRGEVDPSSQEGLMRSLEAATVISPMSTALRAGRSLAPKTAFKQPDPVPTRSELSSATTAAYNEARAMGAAYTPQSIAKWAENTIKSLESESRLARNYPKVHELLRVIKSPKSPFITRKSGKEDSVRIDELDSIYKELGKLGSNKDEGQVASIVQRSLDDYHGTLGPNDLVSSTATPSKAVDLLRQGRGNAAAKFRSDRITELEKTSSRRLAARGEKSSDVDIRQRLTSLIENTKGSRGLSGDEKKAIDAIIYGGITKNTALKLKKLFGSGNSLTVSLMAAAAAAGGNAAFGPMGIALALAPPIIGNASRAVANKISQKELKELGALLRKRSPLYKETPKPKAKYQPGAVQGASEAMTRALLPAAAQSYQKGPNGQAYEIGPNGGYMVDGIEYF
jgi:hypothetical protein